MLREGKGLETFILTLTGKRVGLELASTAVMGKQSGEGKGGGEGRGREDRREEY